MPSPGPELLRRSHGALNEGGSRRVSRTAPQRSLRAPFIGKEGGDPERATFPRPPGFQRPSGFTYNLSLPPTSLPPPLLSLNCFPTPVSCPSMTSSLSSTGSQSSHPCPSILAPRPLRQVHRQAAVGPTPCLLSCRSQMSPTQGASLLSTTTLRPKPGVERALF